MFNPYVSQALAADHIREMYAAADRNRLAVIARCCKPSVWLAAARRIRSHIAATQLGPRCQVHCV